MNNNYSCIELLDRMCKLVYTAYKYNYSILKRQYTRTRIIDKESGIKTTIYHIPCYRITIEILDLGYDEIYLYFNESFYSTSDNWKDEKIFACSTNGKEHIVHYDKCRFNDGWYQFSLIVINFLKEEVTYV